MPITIGAFNMQSQKFVDTRNGEIKTVIPLLEIAHFEKYNGAADDGDFVCLHCGRIESFCSDDPCTAVVADRTAS